MEKKHKNFKYHLAKMTTWAHWNQQSFHTILSIEWHRTDHDRNSGELHGSEFRVTRKFRKIFF